MSELHNVVEFKRPLNDVLSRAIDKWKESDKALDKYKATRLELAFLLLELKQRVEDGEVGDQAAVDWWGWFNDNIGRSKEYAEKLLALASSDRPAAKYEEQKADDRERKANKKVTRVEMIKRGIEATMRSTTDRTSAKNNQETSNDYVKIVPSSTPEQEGISDDERARVEALIAMVRKLRRPVKRWFVTRFKQVYREIF